MTQTIQKLEVYTCIQSGMYGGECGEIATHRIINEGVSVVLCDLHAEPYIQGQPLQVIKCMRCKKSCKPGYIADRDAGHNFCTNTCRDAYHMRLSGVYR